MSRWLCDKCGAGDRASGIESVPEYARPFVRGEIVITVNPLGVCGECYTVLCTRCADRGKCSFCRAPWPLLAECPSTPPDDPTKYAKWRRLLLNADDAEGDGKRRRWWQVWR